MQEPNLKIVILRALLVTAGVLLTLGLLRHFGVLSVSVDPPAPDEVEAVLVPGSALGFLL